MVRVDERLIKPIFINSTILQFFAPNVLQEGPYEVFVSNNGQDFQRGSIVRPLNYYKLLGVT